MNIKYTRYEQPTSKNEWLNSTIKYSLDNPAIKLKKEPYLNKLLQGILQISERPSSITANTIFQTKSVFATNIPSYSVLPSKSRFSRKETRTGKNDNEQKIITCFAPRRSYSQKRLRSLTNQHMEIIKSKKIDESNLNQLVLEAKACGARVINIIFIVRNGLRFEIKQAFIMMSDQNLKSTALKEFKSKIKQELKLNDKNVYIFHLNREPISKLKQIHQTQYSIFVDKSPKLQIPLQLYGDLNQQIKLLERKIKNVQSQLNYDDQIEDHIIDINEYADGLIEDPTMQKQIETKNAQSYKIKSNKVKGILDWYDHGIKQFNKNFTERGSPLPSMNQKSNQVILKETRIQLESFPYIKNTHKIKLTNDEIRQKSNELKTRSKSHSKISSYIHNIKNAKQLNRQLITKHPLLSSQNIPYLIQKYNVPRVEIHTSISATRKKMPSQIMLERGIDRKTFDEGMNGLGYNIGKQIVKTISSFPEFVSWPEFLKIVSITLSKTPEQKLQSILKYVSQDSNTQYLNEVQVDVMVTTCLSKFLGKTQQNDFTDMKSYLLDTIFKQLDPTDQKKIKISALKQRVLKQGKENDLIAFLFLYSD